MRTFGGRGFDLWDISIMYRVVKLFQKTGHPQQLIVIQWAVTVQSAIYIKFILQKAVFNAR